MVWMWYDCGDGSEVVFVNVVNAYKSKKLQRNVKQKIDWKNHKKYRLSFGFFAAFPPIPRHGASLKISEDSRRTSSVVIWFAFVYPDDVYDDRVHFVFSPLFARVFWAAEEEYLFWAAGDFFQECFKRVTTSLASYALSQLLSCSKVRTQSLTLLR